MEAHTGSPHRVSKSPSHQLILFDGVCTLCNGFVQFVIARDPAGRFQFGTLQSASARQLLSRHQVMGALPDSVVLVEEGKVFTQSTAVLRITRRLTFPWSLATVLLAVPTPIRDTVYAFVSRHRYRWLGQRDQCMLPTPALRSRFLD
jgi:predicted DCC family thiol-disulfide oxidoreductase YuxK